MAPAQCVFATLTPSNIHAKLAFSAAYDSALQDSRAAYRQYMSKGIEKRYDEKVHRFRMRRSKKANDGVSDNSSDTDSDFDMEKEPGDLGMIWTGCYEFDLDNPPTKPTAGWGAGKGGSDTQVDFLIIHDEMKRYRAAFNFHPDTGHMYLTSKASRVYGEVWVCGWSIGREEIHALNQSRTLINLGSLN
jgi:hypothetical protein